MMNAENFGPDETLETKSVGLVYLLRYRYHYLKVSPTRVEYLHSKLNSSDKIIHTCQRYMSLHVSLKALQESEAQMPLPELPKAVPELAAGTSPQRLKLPSFLTMVIFLSVIVHAPAEKIPLR